MGELGLNKIFGSILAAALGVMGLQMISSMVFSSGGHHGHHGEKKPFCESVKEDNAYYVDVPCDGATAVANVIPQFVDLGALLAAADPARGERVYRSVCSSCHTIDEGGADGTGPNLYGIINKDIASTAGFGYSGALLGVEGNWTYEQMDAWIEDPANIARGVNMVANVKRGPDRMNLIAYLAANTPNAPAFPDPLPEPGEEPSEGEAEPASAEGEGSGEATDGAIDEAAAGVGEIAVDAVEAGENQLDAQIENAETSGTDAVSEVVETAEETLDGADMPEAPELPQEDPVEVVPDPR